MRQTAAAGLLSCVVGVAAAGCDPATSAPLDAMTAAAPTCGEYCNLVQSICTDTAQQYPSVVACNAYCESFGRLPLGTASDEGGNTVGCRIFHSTVASTTDRDLHCTHAGPTGGDICGRWCENYCHLAQLNCTGDQQLYPGEAECLNACGAFPFDGAIGDETGNTVQCRIFFLGIAGTEPPQSAIDSCPKGAPNGGGACI